MSSGPADPRLTFGPAAERYASSAVHGSASALQRLVDVVRPAGGSVLDIATGSGHTAHAFAPYVDRLVASDFTPQMLRVCRTEALAKGIGNLTVCLANAEILPFRSRSFDGVTCRLAPHHFPDVDRFVKEVYRVLRPGGWFLLVDTVGPDDPSAALEIDGIEAARDPSHVRNLSVAEWLSRIESRGLKVREASESSKRLDTVDWLERTAVPSERQIGIRARIEGSTGAIREYLQPCVVDSVHYFHLREGLILADK